MKEHITKRENITKIDVFFGERYHCTIPCNIPKSTDGWFEKMLFDVCIKKPYLKRREEFTLIWDSDNGPITAKVQPKR